jgi:hypothetical protein
VQHFYSGCQQSIKEVKYLLEYDPYIIYQIFCEKQCIIHHKYPGEKFSQKITLESIFNQLKRHHCDLILISFLRIKDRFHFEFNSFQSMLTDY